MQYNKIHQVSVDDSNKDMGNTQEESKITCKKMPAAKTHSVSKEERSELK